MKSEDKLRAKLKKAISSVEKGRVTAKGIKTQRATVVIKAQKPAKYKPIFFKS